MLGILKRQKEASLAVPSETIMRKPDSEEAYDPLHSAAEDLSKAIHSKNIKAIAESLRAAFQLLDSEPHEEGPHIESEIE